MPKNKIKTIDKGGYASLNDLKMYYEIHGAL